MKKIYANELQGMIGEEITEVFILGEINTSTNGNAVTWSSVMLSDKTGSIEGIIWQAEMQDIYYSYSNTYVQVQAQVTLYNGKPVLSIAYMTPAMDINPDDFVFRIDESAALQLKERLAALIDAVSNSTISAVLQGIFNKSMINCFLVKPAALVYHHAFNGGLMVHAIETAEIAKSMAECENSFSHIKSYHQKTNVDLVIAGALLHDIGKIYTMSSFPFAKRTEKGMFIGHVTESVKIIHAIYKKICDMNDNVDDNSVMLLEHIVRASHEKEASPRIKEALIVRAANKASSVMDAADTVLANADGTVFSKYLNTALVSRKEDKQNV